jgi:hypothetical protein
MVLRIKLATSRIEILWINKEDEREIFNPNPRSHESKVKGLEEKYLKAICNLGENFSTINNIKK